MSAELTIRELRLQAEARDYVWRFRPGVNVLVGPIGVGKTSLLELIKYGFGGDAVLTRTIQGVGRRVRLQLTIEGTGFALARPIGRGAGFVHVEREGEGLGDFAVEAGPDEEGISDFLLEALNVPRLTLPRSRARPRDELTRISFRDLFVYMYLDQQEIDRSTAHDLEPLRNPKRQMTFELIYRLVGSKLADLRVQQVQADAQLRRLQELAANSRAFLKRLGQRSEDELQAARAAVSGSLAEVERELALLRDRARAATEGAVTARGEVAQLENRLVAAQERVAALRSEGSALGRVRAQIEVDQQRIIKALVAGQAFAPYEFAACPRCLQALEDERHPADRCHLCGQAEPTYVGEAALDAELKRLEAQAGETSELLSRNEEELGSAQAQAAHTRAELDEAKRRLDVQTRDAVTPYVDRMQQLSAQVGELRGQDSALQGSLKALNELGRVESEVDEQRSMIARLTDQIKQEEADLEFGRTRVSELAETFAEILQGLDMPWYESAIIDTETYLPVVNGGSLQELSSGGMKTMTNVAYYLANLTYAIANNDSRLPRFMIVDSPRKNFGSSSADREHAGRIYERILSLQALSNTGVAGLARPFQLIVADNDLPDRVARTLGQTRVRRFSYGSPLLDDLTHPGPDVDTIGS